VRIIHWFNSSLFGILAGICLRQVYEAATHITIYPSNTAAIIIFTVLTVMSLFMSCLNFILGIIGFDNES